MPHRRPRRAGPSPGVTVRVASTRVQIASARRLFTEYRRWLATHREVTDFDDTILHTGLARFDAEIRRLPGEYSAPRGALILATAGSRLAGCGGLRGLRGSDAELKRLYVRPRFRHLGIGRRIARTALRYARRMGYRRVLLDTLPLMTGAIGLYRGMGFTPIGPYWAHPVPDALFFEFRLPSPAGASPRTRNNRRAHGPLRR
jgi:putative acetyltransferase